MVDVQLDTILPHFPGTIGRQDSRRCSYPNLVIKHTAECRVSNQRPTPMQDRFTAVKVEVCYMKEAMYLGYSCFGAVATQFRFQSSIYKFYAAQSRVKCSNVSLVKLRGFASTGL